MVQKIKPKMVDGMAMCQRDCPECHVSSSPSYCGVLIAAHGELTARTMVPTYPDAYPCWPWYISRMEKVQQLRLDLIGRAEDAKTFESSASVELAGVVDDLDDILGISEED